MSMVFFSSLMLEKSSNHSSLTRDLKISLAFVMNNTPYTYFLLTVFTHYLPINIKLLLVFFGNLIKTPRARQLPMTPIIPMIIVKIPPVTVLKLSSKIALQPSPSYPQYIN